jgi:hypothetical protein
MKINKLENSILIGFLKQGKSTRALDNMLKVKDAHGWPSWEILQKYNLKNKDKGILFLYKNRELNFLFKKLKDYGGPVCQDRFFSNLRWIPS